MLGSNIIEWDGIFQLEGAYNDHLVQLPDQVRDEQELKLAV